VWQIQFVLVVSIHILDLFVASQASDEAGESLEEGKFVQLVVITCYFNVIF